MSADRWPRAGGAVAWFFRDRTTGRIVIGQWPNLALWLFAVSATLAFVVEAASIPVPAGTGAVLHVVALASIGWWALDELLRGVNPWRRCLGGVVLLLGLWHLLSRT